MDLSSLFSSLSSLHLLLQLHAVPPLPGPWRHGGVAPDLILLLLLSGRPPAATLPPSPDQREQRGPQPHLLSRRLRRPGRPVQRCAISRRRRRLRGPVRSRLLVPGHQQHWPHRPTHPQEGRTGGPPRCHPGSPGTQAAQHAAGPEETVGVSTDHYLLLEIAAWESPGYVTGLHFALYLNFFWCSWKPKSSFSPWQQQNQVPIWMNFITSLSTLDGTWIWRKTLTKFSDFV